MIYTITFNPSIDYIATCNDFKLGETNRTSKEIIYPGGKGINVSIVLNNLGIENTALGFLAGFTGKEIQRLLDEKGISNDMILVEKGFSRINVKLKSNEETELNGMGPNITDEDINKLYQKLDTLQNGDVVVLSGSVLKCVGQGIYADIMEHYKKKDIEFVVDATDALLLDSIQYKPFLIKPNNHELGDLFSVTLDTYEDVIAYAKILQQYGARNILVSMGKKGAVLISEDGDEFISQAPSGTLINSVGAGDSMVAGFLYGYMKYHSYEKAFKYSIASGSASAFSERLATKEEIEILYKTLN